MATYVPNVSQYLPELKPFTPDYKFLSDVLQTRQSKYNTNYKQLNNAYSKNIDIIICTSSYCEAFLKMVTREGSWRKDDIEISDIYQILASSLKGDD